MLAGRQPSAGRLERLGYLERGPDPDDLRSKRIVLTERGVSAIGVIREAVAELESVWAAQLGPERFDELGTCWSNSTS